MRWLHDCYKTPTNKSKKNCLFNNAICFVNATYFAITYQIFSNISTYFVFLAFSSSISVDFLFFASFGDVESCSSLQSNVYIKKSFLLWQFTTARSKNTFEHSIYILPLYYKFTSLIK